MSRIKVAVSAAAGQVTATVLVVTRASAATLFTSNRFTALLARVQSNTSYYYLALRSNNTVELKQLVGGSSTILASATRTGLGSSL
jgi:hypothetical protein